MKKTAFLKRAIAVLLAAMLIICLASCDSEKSKYEQYGIEFMKLEEISGFEFLDVYTGSRDAYACGVKNVTVKELEIPSTYHGKPVIAVVHSTGANEVLTNLKISEGIQYLENCFKNYNALESLTIPKSVTHIFSSFGHCSKLEKLSFTGDISVIDNLSFNSCDALKSVTFEGNVGEISGFAFEKCENLESVDFKGETGRIDGCAFMDCTALKTVILSENTIVDGDAFKNKNGTTFFGSKSMVDYHAGYNTESLLEHAYSVLGKELDEGIKIDDYEAERFARTFNGPIISNNRCPDCRFTDYSSEYLPDDLTLKLDDINTLNVKYPDTVYSEDKAERVLSGSNPLTYCLCEAAGYEKGPDYTYGGVAGNYKYYRISLWNAESGELIAWFLHRTGYAPGSFQSGERITYEDEEPLTNKLFFFEEDGAIPTPVSCVMRYFFGIGK